MKSLTRMRHAERRAIAARFGTRSQRWYVAFKLLMDSVYTATAEELGESRLPLIDMGCGMSLFAHCLHARQRLPRYLGLDHDSRKIEAGRIAAEIGGLVPQLELHCGDAAVAADVRGNVVLLDVLHYLPHAQQSRLLARAVERLAPGGVLILRNVVREPNWRYRATVIEEYLLHASGWMRMGAQHYPTAGEICRPLEAAGLTVAMRPLRGRTPFNSYLVVARRNAADDLRSEIG
jgi:2-polyprenyl-3-methyl-5-hydroxy-6-metoxy-1,4-benzoquinol methylase